MRTRTFPCVLVTVLLLAALSSRSAAQNPTQLPDTPAAKQFGAWLQTFNNSDAEKMLRLFEQPTNRVTWVNNCLRIRRTSGGFDLLKVLDSTPRTFAALVKSRSEDPRIQPYVRVAIQVDATPPNRIVDIKLEPTSTPAELLPRRLSEPDLLAGLKAKLDSDNAAGGFSGTVLVAKDRKPIFSAAYGLADREHNIPNEVSTCFRLGSMNKMFTATAVLQLVQAGRIQLTDTLGKYLPDYPNKELASKVTIHQLLTHTGGTGDFFGPEFTAHRRELRTLQDYVKLFGKRGLAFEPGSKYAYSNYGYILLGVVIEKVTGQDYYGFVRDHLYKPAGMTSTASPPEGEASASCATGYTTAGGSSPPHPNTDTLPYRGTSAGGGYSTVTDLLRFVTALQGHKLLNAQYTDLLTTGKVPVANLAKYAYGFAELTVDGVRSFGHSGGAPGMNGELDVYPQSGYVVVVLANIDPPAAELIGEFVGSRLPR